jgi:hypothetical protein
MSIEHLPCAILTATLLLRLARHVRRRWLRALIRTTVLTAALTAAAPMLVAGSSQVITVGSILQALLLR